MSFNLSGTLNAFRLFARPSLCLPQATYSNFNDLPIPLDSAFQGKNGNPRIQAVVLDKDDCFAVPHSNTVHEPYRVSFTRLNAHSDTSSSMASFMTQIWKTAHLQRLPETLCSAQGGVSRPQAAYCLEHVRR